ncbi:MAG: hypothetical protein UT11_C0070G0015 [Berkelbacteria bacterium GW2011_GWA2_38_9]|uniref:Uncharacterized protein n=1 Tax=Berkelbacteria bacterium GW2011_GWA2_38_9 TaxID=1618334 RepID=A0A0G0NKM6_9BACT|nr:MAG: hypothetical protein UT11_C0070G0015 [Berkelbacteria bacterium GW2011_GWA2_38_9]
MVLRKNGKAATKQLTSPLAVCAYIGVKAQTVKLVITKNAIDPDKVKTANRPIFLLFLAKDPKNTIKIKLIYTAAIICGV